MEWKVPLPRTPNPWPMDGFEPREKLALQPQCKLIYGPPAAAAQDSFFHSLAAYRTFINIFIKGDCQRS